MSEQGGTSHKSREDWISYLPDTLLCKILSDLPTKNAVSTSILSTKWRNIWLLIPLLDLNIDDFSDYISFVSFVDRFLDFSKETSLHKLKFSFKRQEGDLTPITSWIDTAVMRKIQDLYVDCTMSCACDMMPLSLYLCDTLVSLRLQFVTLNDFEFVSLTNLKTMHFEENQYSNDLVLEKLISSCPVLEDLTIVRNVDETVKVLRVRSQTLNTLKLVLDSSKSWYNDDSDDWEVVIDTPRLTYLRLEDDQSVRFVINNVSSDAKVEIDVSFNVNDYYWDINDLLEGRKAVGKLITGLSSIKDMTLSERTLKIFCHYLEYDRMARFCSVTRVEVEIDITELKMLSVFLMSCPSLKSLFLKVKGISEEDEDISLSPCPQCLRWSLEYIEMTRINCGNGTEIKLVRYLLENGAVLKKFKLRVDCRIKEQQLLITKRVKMFSRCSRDCELIVCRI